MPGTESVVRGRLAEEGPPSRTGPRLTRRHAVAAAAAGAVAAIVPAAPARAGSGARHAADLSHVLSEAFPLFPGSPATQRQTIASVEQDGFYVQQWTLNEHVATHVDVPGHFFPGGRRTPAIPASDLVAPLAVVDVSSRAQRDPDTLVTLDDLRAYERGHGRIKPGTVVCMHSGWESRAGDPASFLGTDAGGTMHFPGFAADAAQWLVSERHAGGIGVDTLSLDHGPSQTFDAHVAVLGADRLGVEGLRGLADVPARGATIVIGLVKWEEGSGGPCRALAIW